MFDEDPKRWRLIAEGFTTSGRALEIATAVFPQNFVLLAGQPLLLITGHPLLTCWAGGSCQSMIPFRST